MLPESNASRSAIYSFWVTIISWLLKLKFIPKKNRSRKILDQILKEISEELCIEKDTVNSCLDGSLYQIKQKNISDFQHLDEEDREFFVNSLVNCFQTSLINEVDTSLLITQVKSLIHDAATIAIDLP